jgi:very-short-patch-repair endonuclease
MTNKEQISDFRRATARRLRSNTTNAETLLWRHLRLLETKGTHFRRQVPIGPYVADFACMAARLVIELDGSQHGLDLHQQKDAERTRWLEAEGYRVLRFWNNDVSQSPDAVLETIYDALHGGMNAEATVLKRERRVRSDGAVHPTPARSARRPSPSRGG